MSALPPKADMLSFEIDVCLVPLTDIHAFTCVGERVQVTASQSVQNGRDVSVIFDCGANCAGSRSMATPCPLSAKSGYFSGSPDARY